VGVCFAPCDSKSREPVFQILGSNSRWAVRHEIALLTTNFLSSSSSGKPDSKSSWTSSDDDVTSDMKSLFQRTEALSSHSFRPCRFNAHQPTRPPHEGKHSYNSTSTTIWNSVKTLYFAVLCLLANPVGCITHGPLNSVRPQIVPSAWGLHWAWCSTTSNRTDYNTYETFIMDYASSRSEIVAGWSMGRLTVGQVWMIGCLFDKNDGKSCMHVIAWAPAQDSWLWKGWPEVFMPGIQTNGITQGYQDSAASRVPKCDDHKSYIRELDCISTCFCVNCLSAVFEARPQIAQSILAEMTGRGGFH
jgi:hypothetical protein